MPRRAVPMTAAERVERARNAGRATHTIESLARQLVASWPPPTEDEVDKVGEILRPVLHQLQPEASAA